MTENKVCGIVMPIADCEGRTSSHWTDVRQIIESAAKKAGFESRLVSETMDSNLIHKEILQNIYNDDIIVCDVSARNPNVFFELGVRMATQLPTVIIKDDDTPYPFDTGPNRYIEYPRSLRHPAMEKFKNELEKVLLSTVDHDKTKSFIGQLGPFQIPDVESTKLPASDIIIDRLERIEKSIFTSRNENYFARPHTRTIVENDAINFFRIDDKSAQMLVHGIDNIQVENGLRRFASSLPNSFDFEYEADHFGPFDTQILLKSPKASSEELQIGLRNSILEAPPF